MRFDFHFLSITYLYHREEVWGQRFSWFILKDLVEIQKVLKTASKIPFLARLMICLKTATYLLLQKLHVLWAKKTRKSDKTSISNSFWPMKFVKFKISQILTSLLYLQKFTQESYKTCFMTLAWVVLSKGKCHNFKNHKSGKQSYFRCCLQSSEYSLFCYWYFCSGGHTHFIVQN